LGQARGKFPIKRVPPEGIEEVRQRKLNEKKFGHKGKSLGRGDMVSGREGVEKWEEWETKRGTVSPSERGGFKGGGKMEDP